MTSIEPKVDPKGLYGMKETAAALDLNPSTITRAANATDKTRHLPYSIRRSTGKRVFKGQDIINYWRLTY